MKPAFFQLTLFMPLLSFSQIDTAFIARIKTLDTANVLRADTAAVPNDGLTQKIRILRKERSGLGIETILQMKIMEEQQKDTAHSKGFYGKLLNEITTGRTSQLIDYCLVNLYRRTFTENEIDELITFYRTTAGKKMDREYLLLLVESAKDAEQLLKLAVKRIEQTSQ